MTEAELKDGLKSRRKLFCDYAIEHDWSLRIPLFTAVLLATDPTTLPNYIRSEIGPDTPRDDLLLLDAALALANYHRHYELALPYVSRGEALPSGLISSLEKMAENFDTAIGRIGQFVTA